MKNIIYQYWNGTIPPGSRASRENLQQYAKHIGAEYRFEHNANYTKQMGKHSTYYDAFRPVYDSTFHQYDNVLFLDMDIFAVDKLQENIFEQDIEDIGICEEPLQPTLRQQSNIAGGINGTNDEKWSNALHKKWNTVLPRDSKSRLMVYNSGVVLYTGNGIQKAKNQFVSFNEYIGLMESNSMPKFYSLDQNYLHAMLFSVDINHTIMSGGWNTQIHYVGNPNTKPRPVSDARGEDTKFIHVQLRGADNYDKYKLNRIVNLPQADWKL